MKVKELISILKKEDPEKLALCNMPWGYEDTNPFPVNKIVRGIYGKVVRSLDGELFEYQGQEREFIEISTNNLDILNRTKQEIIEQMDHYEEAIFIKGDNSY